MKRTLLALLCGSLLTSPVLLGDVSVTEVKPKWTNRVRGGIELVFDHDYDDVCAAADKALKKLEFTREPDKRDALVANFNATTADDKKVRIRVSRVTESSTRVEIQVGLVGDEVATRAIVEKMKAAL